jgi:hypothetical protein
MISHSRIPIFCQNKPTTPTIEYLLTFTDICQQKWLYNLCPGRCVKGSASREVSGEIEALIGMPLSRGKPRIKLKAHIDSGVSQRIARPEERSFAAYILKNWGKREYRSRNNPG